MPKLAGINHLSAIRAFTKIGFIIARQGKHVVMRRGDRRIVIPRGNPINAYTMGGIVRDAGLTLEQFKELL
jgi:predicted RNA binding protein YcfA (HicA-like mRNA interferase family)